MSNNIFILTGDIQTGKTTLLQQFCQQQKNAAGILTPIVNSRRMFYDIAGNLLFEMEAAGNEEQVAIGKYLFSAAAFTEAKRILLAASKETGITYLIIDEIGPLEIKKQQGLYHTLSEILSVEFNYTLVLVIRQTLVDEATTVFNLENPVVLGVGEMRKIFSI